MVARSSGSNIWVNVAVIGPYQHGKSTLAGFLLYALQQIPPALVNEADQAASKRKDPSRKFAFLLDRKAHERIIDANGCRGTQEITWWGLERRQRPYLLINSPGWKNRITSLIGTLSDADAIILVIDTGAYLENLKEKAEQKNGQRAIYETIAQIYTQLSLAHFYGIKQLIIAIHKLDKIDFSEVGYLEVKTHLEGLIENLGWDKSQVYYVPTAVIATEEKGYNLTESHPVFSTWPQHTFLLKAIEQLHPLSRSTFPHFRMQLNSVKQGKQVPIPGYQLIITGRITAGNVRVDDEILLQPSGIRCKVHSINSIDNSRYSGATKPWLPPPRGDTGESVSLLCTIIEGEAKVDRGEVVGTVKSSPRVSQRLRAELTLLATSPFSDLFEKNLTGILVMGHFITRFRLDDLSFNGGMTWMCKGLKSSLQNRALLLSTLSNLQNGSQLLGELRLIKQTPIETRAENNNLGRFVLLDSNLSPIFGGYVTEVL